MLDSDQNFYFAPAVLGSYPKVVSHYVSACLFNFNLSEKIHCLGKVTKLRHPQHTVKVEQKQEEFCQQPC